MIGNERFFNTKAIGQAETNEAKKEIGLFRNPVTGKKLVPDHVTKQHTISLRRESDGWVDVTESPSKLVEGTRRIAKTIIEAIVPKPVIKEVSDAASEVRKGVEKGIRDAAKGEMTRRGKRIEQAQRHDRDYSKPHAEKSKTIYLIGGACVFGVVAWYASQ